MKIKFLISALVLNTKGHEIRDAGVTLLTCTTMTNTIQICKMLIPRCPHSTLGGQDSNIEIFPHSFNWFLIKKTFKDSHDVLSCSTLIPPPAIGGPILPPGVTIWPNGFLNEMYIILFYILIIFPWNRVGPFFPTNFSLHDPRVLYAKFGWNWPKGVQ